MLTRVRDRTAACVQARCAVEAAILQPVDASMPGRRKYYARLCVRVCVCMHAQAMRQAPVRHVQGALLMGSRPGTDHR